MNQAQTETCFVLFPTTNQLYPTQISIKNIIIQLKKMDQDASAEITFWQKSKLTISVTHKKYNDFNYNEYRAVEQGNKHFSFSVERVKVNLLINRFMQLEKWLYQFDKQKDKAIIKVHNHRFHVQIKSENSQTQSKSIEEKLLLVDGSNLLHIGFYATKENMMKTPNGKHTNAVFILLRSLLRLMKDLQPSHFAICWDKSKNTFRKELYPDYKANRKEKEPELKEQYKTAQDLLAMMNIPQYSIDKYEADDIIGSFAKSWTSNKNKKCYLASNDQDLYQLLDEAVVQVSIKKGDLQEYHMEDFSNEYGVSPGQWADIKALLGDTSDNIPGVKGVGKKSAFPLIQKYGDIPGLYQSLEELDVSFKRYEKLLKEQREMAYLSKKLATIVTDIPEIRNTDLSSLKVQVNKAGMIKGMKDLQFDSLLKQIKRGAFRAS